MERRRCVRLCVFVVSFLLLTIVATTLESLAGMRTPAAGFPNSHGAFVIKPLATADAISYNGLGPTTVSLTWARSGDVFFGSYTLQYSTAGSNGPWTTLATSTNQGWTSTYVYGLAPGFTYWWQVIDTDAFGGTATSNQLQVTQSSAASLTFTQPTATSAQFSWNNNAVYGGYVAFGNYQLMESINGGAYSSVTTITTQSTMTYTVNGLSAGTGYAFYLQTTDVCSGCTGGSYPSSSYSNVVSFGTVPTLTASVNPSRTNIDIGQPVSLTCTPAGGASPYSFAWTFGDGSTGTGQTVSHTYATVGSKTVTCTVTDNLGTTANGATTLTVSSDPTVTASASHPSVDVSQPVTFSATPSGGSGGYSYAWSGLPSGCTNSGAATVTCSPTSAGTSTVTVSVTDSNGYVNTGSLSFTVYALPSATLAASPASVDVGRSVTFTANPSGGSGGLTYAWSGLPTGCSSSNSATLTCTPTVGGTSSVTVTITDSNGGSGTGSLTFTVYSAPTVTLVSSSTSVDVGHSVTFSANPSGGSGGLTFSWSGLPSGCSSSNSATLTCTPSGAGVITVVVDITDSNGGSGTGSLTFTVYSAPTVTLVSSSTSLLQGQGVTFTATPHGGSGNYAYGWSGLPTGCTDGSNSANVTCVPAAAGSYDVTVTVTDGNGVSAASTTHIDINPSFLGMAAVEGYALLGVIVAVVVIASLVMYMRTRRKKKTPPSQGNTNPSPPPPPQA